ncbi:nitroreductase [Candidatus Poribacteria bacterium]|nr:nitroreductase [Candidatus Poribacteria bacterium]MBT5535255.1 nitroreductase [Candidatus Poribacteria bacterium]MBT5714196.1 nitroreductase [Candidatus Poribacteria bacterium]MBT7803910.1 nitroreductase [Candidatus Poribacteria bacterium]
MARLALESYTSTIRDAIRARRTVFRFDPGEVPRDVLMEILAAGTHSPNHHLTEPWRFTVVGPEMKRVLGQRYREIQAEKCAPGTAAVHVDAAAEKGWVKWMSKPTVVFVSCVLDGDAQQRREDTASVSCAMLNMQLAGCELNVGMQWSTGPITREASTYDLLGIDAEREYIVGLCYMGYPAEVGTSTRRPVGEVTRWTD